MDSLNSTPRKIATALTSMLKTSLRTRSSENSTPTAVVVENDEVRGGGGQRRKANRLVFIGFTNFY